MKGFDLLLPLDLRHRGGDKDLFLPIRIPSHDRGIRPPSQACSHRFLTCRFLLGNLICLHCFAFVFTCSGNFLLTNLLQCGHLATFAWQCFATRKAA